MAALVCPLMRHYGGELHLVKRLHRGRGEHYLPPRAGQAPSGGIVMVQDNGAEPSVMPPSQREPPAVTTAGQPRARKRAGRAPANPGDHGQPEHRPGAGQHGTARMG